MERPVVGFTTDDEGHWVARLGCGHRQHVRHDPPLVERGWVTTAAGRAGKIGQTLECVRCDAFELPDECVAYRRTDVFDAVSMPDGLRSEHRTKPGVWGRIVVLEGRLRYHVRGTTHELAPDTAGIVVPELSHHVEAVGAARFFVEFLRVPGPAA